MAIYIKKFRFSPEYAMVVHLLDLAGVIRSKHIIILKKTGANKKEGISNEYKFPGRGR